ncbi:phosphatase PAP2 family protein [Nibribacter ruber]|uniref:Phosphatase PAP2 family protein n=1 Tax=Nibribacter ruber TaxID=2698458 RepID=A0A6P1P173_9BACT|nr:phosphatase PAP2 family protein [Nibribacter ruber]QHL87303.1 phosphatase PAP2 family protein [Nibribacter ruber]
MKNHFRQHKSSLLLSGGMWLLLVLVLCTFPVAFSGYLASDLDTNFWYWLSESGGVFGTTALAVLLCGLAAAQQKGLRRKFASFSVAFGFLLVTLGGIAAVNEYYIKPLTQIPRPSHLFLLQPTHQIEKFYLQDVPARQAFLQRFIQENPTLSADVSPLVLAHWVQECGYSFPSGHSLNVFLLGTMLALFLGWQLPRKKQLWLLVPLGWALLVCLSRVALGVHSEWDVALGSAVGFTVAYLLSVSGILHRVFKAAASTHSDNSL